MVSLESLQHEAFPGDDLLTGISEKGKNTRPNQPGQGTLQCLSALSRKGPEYA